MVRAGRTQLHSGSSSLHALSPLPIAWRVHRGVPPCPWEFRYRPILTLRFFQLDVTAPEHDPRAGPVACFTRPALFASVKASGSEQAKSPPKPLNRDAICRLCAFIHPDTKAPALAVASDSGAVRIWSLRALLETSPPIAQPNQLAPDQPVSAVLGAEIAVAACQLLWLTCNWLQNYNPMVHVHTTGPSTKELSQLISSNAFKQTTTGTHHNTSTRRLPRVGTRRGSTGCDVMRRSEASFAAATMLQAQSVLSHKPSRSTNSSYGGDSMEQMSEQGRRAASTSFRARSQSVSRVSAFASVQLSTYDATATVLQLCAFKPHSDSITYG